LIHFFISLLYIKPLDSINKQFGNDSFFDWDFCLSHSNHHRLQFPPSVQPLPTHLTRTTRNLYWIFEKILDQYLNLIHYSFFSFLSSNVQTLVRCTLNVDTISDWHLNSTLSCVSRICKLSIFISLIQEFVSNIFKNVYTLFTVTMCKCRCFLWSMVGFSFIKTLEGWIKTKYDLINRFEHFSLINNKKRSVQYNWLGLHAYQ